MARARTKRAQRKPSETAHSVVRTRSTSKAKNRKRPYPLKLAGKLRELRERLGLSQGEIAKRIGVKDRASISGYERGEREPPLPTLLRYAELAGCSTDYLIDDRLELPRTKN